ncbi:hypothetical protein [Mesorhizobium sp. CAU 1732]|uniref:hypothetical protein n=1 Tax=Mesorhizobium sp. CAU 1732 TaxID=3140358 RepID=UPI0032605E3C
MSDTNAVLVVFESALSRWRGMREAVRTRRIVSSLPEHIRKDIGWRDTAPDRMPSRANWWL